MNQDRLADLLERPEVQKEILGNYSGGYSIGLTRDPSRDRQLAIRVRLAAKDAAQIPSKVILDDEVIPVIVQTNFLVPEPL